MQQYEITNYYNSVNRDVLVCFLSASNGNLTWLDENSANLYDREVM
jgi:hypothetical protein